MTDPFARPSDQPPQDSELTVPLEQSGYTPTTQWPAPEETLVDPLAQAESWRWDAQANPSVNAAPDYGSPTAGAYPTYPTAGASTPQYGPASAGYPTHPASIPAPWTPNVPYAYSEAALPEHPSATTSLVLGILSIVGVIPLGPVAWYIGAKAQREMRENPGRWRPSGSLTAGVILGVIATIPLVFLLIFLVIFLVFGIVRMSI